MRFSSERPDKSPVHCPHPEFLPVRSGSQYVFEIELPYTTQARHRTNLPRSVMAFVSDEGLLDMWFHRKLFLAEFFREDLLSQFDEKL